MKKQKVSKLLLGAAVAGLLTGSNAYADHHEKGKMQKAGNKVDKAAKKAGKDTGDKVEKAGAKADKAMDKMKIAKGEHKDGKCGSGKCGAGDCPTV